MGESDLNKQWEDGVNEDTQDSSYEGKEDRRVWWSQCNP